MFELRGVGHYVEINIEGIVRDGFGLFAFRSKALTRLIGMSGLLRQD